MNNNEYQSHFNQIGNYIEVEGARLISKLLELNTTLTSLDLTCKSLRFTHKMNNNEYHFYLLDNEIGVEGAKLIAKSLELNTTLTSLNLYSKLFHS